MDHSAPVDIDPRELERAQAFWTRFTRFVLCVVLFISALLILMALFLL